MDEIVADGCELMLENTEIFNKLAKMDKSIAQQVADYIKGMLKRLYEGITGKHHKSQERTQNTVGIYRKSQQNNNSPGVQFSDGIMSADYVNNLSQSTDIVNAQVNATTFDV